VTSRSVLRLSGEVVFPIPPLELPARRRASTPRPSSASAPCCSSSNARAPSTRTSSSTENAAAVVEICRRVDALPLAIELAAARVRALPPPVLLARMTRRLPLLRGGPRDAPERQRTLRDAIEWSVALLDPSSARLFARLSVFEGGGTEGGDRAVLGDTDVMEASSLIDKSSAAARRHDDGDRVSMLETCASTRPSGFEAIPRPPTSANATRARTSSSPRPAGARSRAPSRRSGCTWFATLGNLRAAMSRPSSPWARRWKRCAGDGAAAAVHGALPLRGGAAAAGPGAGRRARHTGSVPRGRPAGAGRADVASGRPGGVARAHRGEPGHVPRVGRRSPAPRTALRLLRGPRPQLRATTTWRAPASRRRWRSCAARRRPRRASPTRCSVSATSRSIAAKRWRRRTTRRAARSPRIGDTLGVAYALDNLGALAWCRGALTAADAHTDAVDALYVQLDHPIGHANVAHRRGLLALARNALDDAERHLRASLTIRERIGDVRGAAFVRHDLGRVALERGDATGAERQLLAGLDLAERHGAPLILVLYLEALAALCAQRGAAGEALELLSAAITWRRAERVPLCPVTRPRHEALVRRLRAALDPADWRTTEALGAARSVSDAVTRARACLAGRSRTPPTPTAREPDGSDRP
jgi:hypothetical protein